jgi:phospholipid transport system substrate-binding protein
MKRMSLLWIAAVMLVTAAAASPAKAAAVPPQAAPIAALDEALIATMKAGSANASFMSRYGMLDPVVKRTFNLPVILQNSVGFLWSTVPAAQQEQLLLLFEEFTVASYINGFVSYAGEQFQLLPAERTIGAKKIVESQIVPGDGSAPTRLDYVMANGPDGWRVTDVLLNGTISKVAIQSSDFSALVTSGDAGQLILALKSKIAGLSNGYLGR